MQTAENNQLMALYSQQEREIAELRGQGIYIYFCLCIKVKSI
jgi:hypothetical protein